MVEAVWYGMTRAVLCNATCCGDAVVLLVLYVCFLLFLEMTLPVVSVVFVVQLILAVQIILKGWLLVIW